MGTIFADYVAGFSHLPSVSAFQVQVQLIEVDSLPGFAKCRVPNGSPRGVRCCQISPHRRWLAARRRVLYPGLRYSLSEGLRSIASGDILTSGPRTTGSPSSQNTPTSTCISMKRASITGSGGSVRIWR